ncbi:NUDIX hydrolase [Dinoroseobacter shibae DFL 12 = DSM 16493]|jgi:nudix-type nucleoside diphosphatase (YffH/AdpP family)|uniref:ADP-ribose pyrophosphatase n=1 Tax=Dinoroseobacter shibae (strain DSM 16493 / NCIMB 14021 / DFL 12) TaxID=398580 RepID=A8LRM0_DINSH|nr:gamma-glutamylcyclotransferase [Dinoroseobacter shibae]ABV94051.1 NUDIX hydrolase [Dinoroseobacter shibae DFL 12 = DSM 16493]URF45492.1 NUDIX domain-containing protein [Dinoroseobacter shibae]URF49797.1 NUDIX domain-containing protein [Dinoroseobacter shibae]
MTDIFVFGTLRDLSLLEIVLGQLPERREGWLLGARTVCAAGHDFPISIPAAPSDRSPGLLLIGLSADDIARLDFYEDGFGYLRRTATVTCADGTLRQAQLYRPTDDALRPGGPWDLSAWQDRHGAVTRETALEAMSYFGTLTSAEMAALWPVMAARAQSRLAARTRPAPVRDDLPSRDAVVVERTDIPYNKFFRLEEHHLRFPHFDGGLSDPVSRVAFVAVDAVTVLPYDPVRDRVLLVDQFRIGPYVRGDAQPWTLEPIAGRVDGGETWEETVHREAREEAGLTMWHLERIGTYYPSPGAVTESLASYVGLTDLPDDAVGLFGVDHEAEDIKTRIVGFDTLMAMTRDGRVQNGPLMISALWLAAERARLRTLPRPDT